MSSTSQVSPFHTWGMYSPVEKRNLIVYVVGIMLYKFGLEAFNGSVQALATNRYDFEAARAGKPSHTFERVGLLVGLNQASQCAGSILIAPLVKRFPTKLVLSMAIFVFGLLTAVLLILDAARGGGFRPKNWHHTHKANDFSYYGNYDTDGIIPIYCIAGIAYGMVELIRRVIPRDIVGGDVQKLRRLDAIVHIFYEIAGTGGAFTTALGLVPVLGHNMAFIITPICFSLAAVSWFFITNLDFQRADEEPSEPSCNYLKSVGVGFYLFFKSIAMGAYIVLSSRKFIWLLPGYSFALYLHRYLENGVCPIIARRYLGQSEWAQIMVGGSNFGELIGALCVFLLTNVVHTPMPWLRIDSMMAMIPWFLAFWQPARNQVGQAFVVAAALIPFSFGWAAGDVSLAAYIQACLAREEGRYKDVSPLGAVMAFLYSFYIVMYAICQPLLGRYVDRVYNRNGGEDASDVHEAVFNVVGVQFTVYAIVIFASTFLPQGSFALNPAVLDGQDLEKDREKDQAKKEEAGTEERKEGDAETPKKTDSVST